jgi:hypothetical protein
MISQRQLVAHFQSLGVRPGGVLLLHTAFSKIKPVDGGPQSLIAALREALGPDGTLVMPSMTDDDDHVFDPRSTPCAGIGIVADTFWRLPGASRIVFARILNVATQTVQAWEQGRNIPAGAALRLLRIVSAHPEVVLMPVLQAQGGQKQDSARYPYKRRCQPVPAVAESAAPYGRSKTKHPN